MSNSQALVVGAGPTGMTAAIELRRAGMDVRVIDKSDQMALHSQALVVQARTLEQFQRYGIAEKAVARGRKMTGAKFWSDGKPIMSLLLDSIPGRYPFVLFLPQNETEALLNEYLESLGAKIERGVELVSITQENGVIRSVLRHPDGSQENLESRWIIACDGAHSKVRDLMKIPFEGQGVGISFFLGDVALDGPDAPSDELAIHLSHGNVVFMGRLDDKFTRLIVALHSKQDEQTWKVPSVQDFQEAVDRSNVRVTVRSVKWATPFRVSDRQAKTYRQGSVFLAGDASHIHSPVGGQGMNTGIQDAANLIWKLAAVGRGADEALLNTYEEERVEVGKALLRFTERGLRMATTTNPLVESVRDVLAPILSSTPFVKKAMAGFISETAVEYRSSSAVADHGGDGALRAGDRMPDLSLSNGATLLGNWTDSRHLAVFVNAGESEMATALEYLRPAGGTSVMPSDLDDEGRRLLGTEMKLLLLRPDGYIGFRGPIQAHSELARYARQVGLT